MLERIYYVYTTMHRTTGVAIIMSKKKKRIDMQEGIQNMKRPLIGVT